MITMAPNPSLRQIFKFKVKMRNECSVWSKIGKGEIFTHRSWISLQLIVNWVKKNKNTEKIVMFVPDYYCYDTLYQIEKSVHLVYYPISEKLEPDLAECRKLADKFKPDIFLFCHFWGKVLPVNDTFVFCNTLNAIFVEDAVHMLAPDKRLGKKSDFILFSPWKLLGLPDGAILIFGKNSRYFNDDSSFLTAYDFFDSLIRNYPKYDKYINKWKIKRLLLKVIPMIKKNTLDDNRTNVKPDNFYSISSYSKNFLLNYTEAELLQMGQRRKENASYLFNYCKRNYESARLIIENDDIPYMLPFCIPDPDDKQRILKDFNRVGRVVSTWPRLSGEIGSRTLARQIAEDTVAFAVHGNLSINLLKKKLKDKLIISDNCLNKLKMCEISSTEYEDICSNKSAFIPLLQSYSYAAAKQNAQRWKPSFWAVYKDEKCIGCFIALKKDLIISVYRINGGPVWFQYNDDNDMSALYSMIIKKFSGFLKVLFIAPHEERTSNNLAIMVRNGLFYRKSFASTGLIDLSLSQEDLRKKLDGKWRNQLKTAEKKGYDVKKCTGTDEFEHLLKLHINHKKSKGYDDSGDNIARELFKNGSLIGMYVGNSEAAICAFIFVAVHNNSATYFIGWSNEEGYSSNLNKLLLWKAIIKLKEHGYKWFDLGGINFIKTPSIAEFKMGMGCRYFEAVGEFVKI